MDTQRLLIIEDDTALSSQIRWAFSNEYEVIEAADRPTAISKVKKDHPDVVMLDLGLPPEPKSPAEGLRRLSEILSIDPAAKILIITGHAKKDNALKAIELGAFDFFPKPVPLEEMRITVKRAFHVSRLEHECMSQSNRFSGEGLFEMLGKGSSMKAVFNDIHKVSTADIPVLILGESGTGKEMAANAIHKLSQRKTGPFTVINCSAIPENLLESELFGHEKGAFTDAVAALKGKVEYADGGTLFLDEIGELSPKLQVKLLRFLQEHTIERIGGRRHIRVDARIITATNRDLKAMVNNGDFREDLYYRLCAITIELPPLRERGNDVCMLALSFFKTYLKKFRKKNIQGFSDSAVKAIKNYSWPGNIRELENKIKGAIAMCQADEISAEDLALPLSEYKHADKNPKRLLEAREEFEKKIIQEALLRNNGVIARAAEELGISRQHLTDLIRKFDIKTH